MGVDDQDLRLSRVQANTRSAADDLGRIDLIVRFVFDERGVSDRHFHGLLRLRGDKKALLPFPRGGSRYAQGGIRVFHVCRLRHCFCLSVLLLNIPGRRRLLRSLTHIRSMPEHVHQQGARAKQRQLLCFSHGSSLPCLSSHRMHTGSGDMPPLGGASLDEDGRSVLSCRKSKARRIQL